MNLYYNLVLDSDSICVGQVGGFETLTLVEVEPSLKYHPYIVRILILARESGQETVLGG